MTDAQIDKLKELADKVKRTGSQKDLKAYVLERIRYG